MKKLVLKADLLRRKYLLSLKCFGVLCFLLFGSHAYANAQSDKSLDQAEKPLVFGIVPQQSATRLASVWVPFLKEVSLASGRQLVFATAKDIPAFEACLASQAYDIAYMNPYHYTVFSSLSGYKAFARQKQKKLRGLIVVRKASGIKTLEELHGKMVAFPSPAAFGASVIPRAELAQRQIAFTPQYVKSHDSVYRAVSAGLIPAGGGVLRTFNTAPDTIRNELEVIYRTKAYTPHAFAHRPDMDEGVMPAILQAMLDLNGTRPDLLKTLGMKGIEAGHDQDWDDVRALGLDTNHTEIVHQDTQTCRSS